MYFLLVLIPLGMLTPGSCPRLLLESQDWGSINHTQLTLTCSLLTTIRMFHNDFVNCFAQAGLLRVCPGQTAWCPHHNVSDTISQSEVSDQVT